MAKRKVISKKKKSSPIQNKWILDSVKESNSLRSKDREFHGLEREFIYYQEDILRKYDQSKDLKHPRDIGTVREVVLRDFLSLSGYVPRKYGVSKTSARVISTSGHSSNEIDILIYDADNAITLMSREGVYEAYPIECVYGVIQVKSKLIKAEITSGLENISSYKSLYDKNAEFNMANGFGILFAYDSDMDWVDIVNEVKLCSESKPRREWCNAIIILNKGCIFHGAEGSIALRNQEIEKILELQMHGRPDHSSGCLYSFYSILMSLLRQTTISMVDIDNYFRLPLVSGKYSYEFSFGHVSEKDKCERHGVFHKKILDVSLEKIMSFVESETPINWVRATDLAYGRMGDNYEQYEQQPGNIRVYNPEKLPLAEILTTDSLLNGASIKALAFDSITCEGINIWIPYYYSYKENIIEGCPKCKAEVARKQKMAAAKK